MLFKERRQSFDSGVDCKGANPNNGNSHKHSGDKTFINSG